jgi:hypothetical protein
MVANNGDGEKERAALALIAAHRPRAQQSFRAPAATPIAIDLAVEFFDLQARRLH